MEPNKDYINIVITQTNYNEKEAQEKLIEHDNNYLEVIKNYLNPSKIKKDNSKKKTTNQLMYGEFRNLMDDASRNHRIQKEKEDKINQFIQNINIQKKKEKEEKEKNS